MPFAFESLTIYQKSLDWVEDVETLSQRLKGHVSFSFLDQLSRASLSIPLNIAQGSVFEIVPIIQILYRRNFIQKPGYDFLYKALEELAKMLTNLIKSVEELKRD